MLLNLLCAANFLQNNKTCAAPYPERVVALASAYAGEMNGMERRKLT
jgi:hypothetical protein